VDCFVGLCPPRNDGGGSPLMAIKKNGSPRDCVARDDAVLIKEQSGETRRERSWR
jgi:hypothetical protein